MEKNVPQTDAEWREVLTPEAYRILRQKGTEPAFTGEYYANKAQGIYLCAGCGESLFSSESKYDSGSGWPSFYAPVTEQTIATEADNTYGMTRVEIKCAQCDSHLGHVFEDGPQPTGLRYCVNSASLKFKQTSNT